MRRSVQRNRAMSEINITPLTDVMMVLLIIFMVTTPLILKASIDINLPKVHAKTAAPALPIQITLTADGKLMVNGTPITFQQLGPTLAELIKKEGDTPVTVSADERVFYGEAIKLLDVARQAGATKLMLAAEPLPTQPLSEEILKQ